MTTEEIDLHQKVRLMFIQNIVNRSGPGPDDAGYSATELMDMTREVADEFVYEYQKMRAQAQFAGAYDFQDLLKVQF